MATQQGTMGVINYSKDKALIDAGRGRGFSAETIGRYLAMPAIGGMNAASGLNQPDYDRAAEDGIRKPAASLEMKRRYSGQSGTPIGEVYAGDAAGLQANTTKHVLNPDGTPGRSHKETGKSSKEDNSQVRDDQKRTFEGEDYGLGNVAGLSTRSGDVEAFKRAIPKDWDRNATSREKLNEDITTAIEKQIVADKTRSVGNSTSLNLSATATTGTPLEGYVGSGVKLQGTLSNQTSSNNVDTRRRNEIYEQVSTATREVGSNPGFKDKESRDKALFDRIQVIKNGYSDTGSILSHGNNARFQYQK